MGSITLPFWRGGRELYPEQQQLSLMIAVSQQILHFFFFPPPFLCIPTLVSFAPSRLPPYLNKSPASQGWDSSCCCLALIWCNDTHNASHFGLPAERRNLYFRQSWIMWGKGIVATSFGLFILPSLWSAVEILSFSSYFGLFQQTKPAAIVFFWPLYTWQSLIRAFAVNSCGGRLIPLLICVHFPDDYSAWVAHNVESWWIEEKLSALKFDHSANYSIY